MSVTHLSSTASTVLRAAPVASTNRRNIPPAGPLNSLLRVADSSVASKQRSSAQVTESPSQQPETVDVGDSAAGAASATDSWLDGTSATDCFFGIDKWWSEKMLILVTWLQWCAVIAGTPTRCPHFWHTSTSFLLVLSADFPSFRPYIAPMVRLASPQQYNIYLLATVGAPTCVFVVSLILSFALWTVPLRISRNVERVVVSLFTVLYLPFLVNLFKYGLCGSLGRADLGYCPGVVFTGGGLWFGCIPFVVVAVLTLSRQVLLHRASHSTAAIPLPLATSSAVVLSCILAWALWGIILGSQYWFICGLPFALGLPIWVATSTYQSLVFDGDARHEHALRSSELVYLLRIDCSYRNDRMWLHSSFRRCASFYLVYDLAMKLLLVGVQTSLSVVRTLGVGNSSNWTADSLSSNSATIFVVIFCADLCWWLFVRRQYRHATSSFVHHSTRVMLVIVSSLALIYTREAGRSNFAVDTVVYDVLIGLHWFFVFAVLCLFGYWYVCEHEILPAGKYGFWREHSRTLYDKYYHISMKQVSLLPYPLPERTSQRTRLLKKCMDTVECVPLLQSANVQTQSSRHTLSTLSKRRSRAQKFALDSPSISRGSIPCANSSITALQNHSSVEQTSRLLPLRDAAARTADGLILCDLPDLRTTMSSVPGIPNVSSEAPPSLPPSQASFRRVADLQSIISSGYGSAERVSFLPTNQAVSTAYQVRLPSGMRSSNRSSECPPNDMEAAHEASNTGLRPNLLLPDSRDGDRQIGTDNFLESTERAAQALALLDNLVGEDNRVFTSAGGWSLFPLNEHNQFRWCVNDTLLREMIRESTLNGYLTALRSAKTVLRRLDEFSDRPELVSISEIRAVLRRCLPCLEEMNRDRATHHLHFPHPLHPTLSMYCEYLLFELRKARALSLIQDEHCDTGVVTTRAGLPTRSDFRISGLRVVSSYLGRRMNDRNFTLALVKPSMKRMLLKLLVLKTFVDLVTDPVARRQLLRIDVSTVGALTAQNLARRGTVETTARDKPASVDDFGPMCGESVVESVAFSIPSSIAPVPPTVLSVPPAKFRPKKPRRQRPMRDYVVFTTPPSHSSTVSDTTSEEETEASDPLQRHIDAFMEGCNDRRNAIQLTEENARAFLVEEFKVSLLHARELEETSVKRHILDANLDAGFAAVVDAFISILFEDEVDGRIDVRDSERKAWDRLTRIEPPNPMVSETAEVASLFPSMPWNPSVDLSTLTILLRSEAEARDAIENLERTGMVRIASSFVDLPHPVEAAFSPPVVDVDSVMSTLYDHERRARNVIHYDESQDYAMCRAIETLSRKTALLLRRESGKRLLFIEEENAAFQTILHDAYKFNVGSWEEDNIACTVELEDSEVVVAPGPEVPDVYILLPAIEKAIMVEEVTLRSVIGTEERAERKAILRAFAEGILAAMAEQSALAVQFFDPLLAESATTFADLSDIEAAAWSHIMLQYADAMGELLERLGGAALAALWAEVDAAGTAVRAEEEEEWVLLLQRFRAEVSELLGKLGAEASAALWAEVEATCMDVPRAEHKARKAIMKAFAAGLVELLERLGGAALAALWAEVDAAGTAVRAEEEEEWVLLLQRFRAEVSELLGKLGAEASAALWAEVEATCMDVPRAEHKARKAIMKAFAAGLVELLERLGGAALAALWAEVDAAGTAVRAEEEEEWVLLLQRFRDEIPVSFIKPVALLPGSPVRVIATSKKKKAKKSTALFEAQVRLLVSNEEEGRFHILDSEASSYISIVGQFTEGIPLPQPAAAQHLVLPDVIEEPDLKEPVADLRHDFDDGIHPDYLEALLSTGKMPLLPSDEELVTRNSVSPPTTTSMPPPSSVSADSMQAMLRAVTHSPQYSSDAARLIPPSQVTSTPVPASVDAFFLADAKRRAARIAEEKRLREEADEAAAAAAAAAAVLAENRAQRDIDEGERRRKVTSAEAAARTKALELELAARRVEQQQRDSQLAAYSAMSDLSDDDEEDIMSVIQKQAMSAFRSAQDDNLGGPAVVDDAIHGIFDAEALHQEEEMLRKEREQREKSLREERENQLAATKAARQLQQQRLAQQDLEEMTRQAKSEKDREKRAAKTLKNIEKEKLKIMEDFAARQNALDASVLPQQLRDEESVVPSLDGDSAATLDATWRMTFNAMSLKVLKAHKQALTVRLNAWKQEFAREHGVEPSKKHVKADAFASALYAEYNACTSVFKERKAAQ